MQCWHVCAGGKIAPSLHLTQQVAGIQSGLLSGLYEMFASRIRAVCSSLGTQRPKSALALMLCPLSIPLVGLFVACEPNAAPHPPQTLAFLRLRQTLFSIFFHFFLSFYSLHPSQRRGYEEFFWPFSQL